MNVNRGTNVNWSVNVSVNVNIDRGAKWSGCAP